jgi:hypothetical protein
MFFCSIIRYLIHIDIMSSTLTIHRLLVLASILLMQATVSCSQSRTYLTEQEKGWNPYTKGQVLVFMAEDGRTDTLTISAVEDKQFPDGIGARQNERLRVLARVRASVAKSPIEVVVLYVTARTAKSESEIDFNLSVADGGFWGKYIAIHHLEALIPFSLQTQYGTFDDVLRIDDDSSQPIRNRDIKTIFWSKSSGYIKCIKQDGSAWELVNIF